MNEWTIGFALIVGVLLVMVLISQELLLRLRWRYAFVGL
jgi:hypothetical protein